MNPFLRCPDTISPLKPPTRDYAPVCAACLTYSSGCSTDGQCANKWTHLYTFTIFAKVQNISAPTQRAHFVHLRHAWGIRSPALSQQASLVILLILLTWSPRTIKSSQLKTFTHGLTVPTKNTLKYENLFSVNFEPCIVEYLNPMTFKMANIATNTHICFYWVI